MSRDKVDTLYYEWMRLFSLGNELHSGVEKGVIIEEKLKKIFKEIKMEIASFSDEHLLELGEKNYDDSGIKGGNVNLLYRAAIEAKDSMTGKTTNKEVNNFFLKLAKDLVRAGVDVNSHSPQPWGENFTVICYAAQTGDKELINGIVDKEGFDWRFLNICSGLVLQNLMNCVDGLSDRQVKVNGLTESVKDHFTSEKGALKGRKDVWEGAVSKLEAKPQQEGQGKWGTSKFVVGREEEVFGICG